MEQYQEIIQKIDKYKSRLYWRQLWLGSFSFLTFNIILFLTVASIEYQLWLESAVRALLLSFLITFFSFTLIYLVIRPLLKVLKLGKVKNDEEAAIDISKHFPEIEDKLTNLLQLRKHTATSDRKLIFAAIEAKARGFKKFEFSTAVNFKKVKKYGSLFLIVFSVLIILSFISPEVVKESPSRIINYSTAYEKKTPFLFHIQNEDFSVFRGDDFTFSFTINGEIIPEKVELKINNKNNARLISDKTNTYHYTFKQVQSTKSFEIEAEGHSSSLYKLNLLERPSLNAMKIEAISPAYTNGGIKSHTNSGNITILEGSKVLWEIEGLHIEEANIFLESDLLRLKDKGNNQFFGEKVLYQSSDYEIKLKNKNSRNKSQLKYDIEVIKDKYPHINADFIPDSISYQFIWFLGTISDDYGFTALSLKYRTDEEKRFSSVPIEIDKSSLSQRFYAAWSLDSIELKMGGLIEMHLVVSDNDPINGYKKSKSQPFVFKIPDQNEIDSLLEGKSQKLENELSNSKNDVEELSERIEYLKDRLKTERELGWQGKKMVEDLIKDKEAIYEKIAELQKKYEELKKSQERLKTTSEAQQEKNKKFQKLMEQLLDKETQELYEKLHALLKENASADQINEQLQKLQQNEKNLEKDLERASELFKRLKMEAQLEQNIAQLDSLSKKQSKASEEEVLEKSESIQEEIEKEFRKFMEKMEKVMGMNQELKKPEALDNFEYEEKQIAKKLNEIGEQLNRENTSKESEKDIKKTKRQEKKNKNTGEMQRNAAQQMKKLNEKLSNMHSNMQMEVMQVNLNQLRNILDNLLKLSFNQENLMDEMRKVNQSDPRFLTITRSQLKLKDDSKIIQDSLLSLASRVIQISSFVTDEIESINRNIEEALEHLKDRNKARASSNQQFAMTSINNLALLLDDTMQQMQMSISGSKSTRSEEGQELPELSVLQKELGEKIEKLRESGKSGRELSEELAKLAAEQERIRRQLQEFKQAEEGKRRKNGVENLKRAIEMMQRNEIDLVNKRLSKQLMFRQKIIETRLLEAEKADREQEEEEKREANSPSIKLRKDPPEFEEYLKQRKKEIELLKTIPLELNPFYKKEVNDYFRRISSNSEE